MVNSTRLADRATERAALVERNRKLTAERHRATGRERLRRAMLRFAATLPVVRAKDADPNTLLLVRPDHLGDVLLSMPAIQALKRANPSLRLVALAGAWSAEVLAAYPEIDLVLTLPFPGFTRDSRRGFWPVDTLRWARQVRQLNARAAVLLRPDHWWGGLLTKLGGVRRRVGYRTPDLSPFLTERIPFSQQHSVLEVARLLEAWTGRLDPASLRLTFPVSELDEAYIDGLLNNQARPGAPLIVLHPGAGSPIKTWPPDHLAYIADWLTERWDGQIVFTGSDREHEQVWQVMDRMRRPAFSLAGETNIGQLAALYRRAAVVIGPDTGPLHLAVASGAPTVHLYGPADPAQFGPWGDVSRHAVVTSGIGCRPCRVLDWSGDDPANHPCIREINVQQVIEAAQRVMFRAG